MITPRDSASVHHLYERGLFVEVQPPVPPDVHFEEFVAVWHTQGLIASDAVSFADPTKCIKSVRRESSEGALKSSQ